MDWGTWFLNWIEKIMKQNSKGARARQATTAEQAVMRAFGLQEVTAKWLIETLEQEGYEIKPIQENL